MTVCFRTFDGQLWVEAERGGPFPEFLPIALPFRAVTVGVTGGVSDSESYGRVGYHRKQSCRWGE